MASFTETDIKEPSDVQVRAADYHISNYDLEFKNDREEQAFRLGVQLQKSDGPKFQKSAENQEALAARRDANAEAKAERESKREERKARKAEREERKAQKAADNDSADEDEDEAEEQPKPKAKSSKSSKTKRSKAAATSEF
jgi:hypothetical protein